jgi:hypothetical protein
VQAGVQAADHLGHQAVRHRVDEVRVVADRAAPLLGEPVDRSPLRQVVPAAARLPSVERAFAETLPT